MVNRQQSWLLMARRGVSGQPLMLDEQVTRPVMALMTSRGVSGQPWMLDEQVTRPVMALHLYLSQLSADSFLSMESIYGTSEMNNSAILHSV